MTVGEVLSAAREAAIQMRRIEEQRQVRLLSVGPGGHTYDVHTKSGILDPSRKIIDLIDFKDSLVDTAELRRPIEEAAEVVNGIAKISDEVTVEMVTRYYLQAESWNEIARDMEGRVDALRDLTRAEQSSLLQKTMDACVKHWDVVGLAHLKEMGK